MNEPLNNQLNSPRILVSVFACSPEWGSEVGMGWNWVVALSSYCSLDVITESSFRPSIERHYNDTFKQTNKPRFYYVDIEPKGIKAFWNQGDWSFYYYYRRWQKKAYRLGLQLTQSNRYDIIHQLNLVGFREPGYLWRIKTVPFVLGPICGMGTVPIPFVIGLDPLTGLKYIVKNAINYLQQLYLPRLKHTINNSRFVFVVTPTEKEILLKRYRKESTLLSEVGTDIPRNVVPRQSRDDDRLIIIWNGIMEGRKGLNLLLYALRKAKDSGLKFETHIIGDGPCRKQWETLCSSLGVEDNCIWHGRTSHDEALRIMNMGDVFIFTSWKEATSTVINEALSMGLPVICHDCCGMSFAINETCGIKIPLHTPQKSIDGIYQAIVKLYSNRYLIKEYSSGALLRAKQLSWDNHAKTVLSFYLRAKNDCVSLI